MTFPFALARSRPQTHSAIAPWPSRFHARLRLAILLCVAAIPCPITASDVVRYTGSMTSPIDLFTQEGAKIEKRRYDVTVTSDGTLWTLSFLQEGKDAVCVKGKLAEGDLFNLPALIPVVGAHYMRSSTEPLKTAQERQFSKTGLPQYAEQERDWKATIRVYKNSKEPAEIFFIFQVRNAGSQPTRADFKLRSEALDGKR